MKHLLKMSDLSPAELHHILDVAEELKAEQKAGTTPALLKGRSVALMFSKNSTRTRTSFEVGVYQLGGLGNYMNAATELQSCLLYTSCPTPSCWSCSPTGAPAPGSTAAAIRNKAC